MTTQELLSRPRTFKELCQHYSLSPNTLRKLLIEAGLPAQKKGSGRYYYTIPELERLRTLFESERTEGNVVNCDQM